MQRTKRAARARSVAALPRPLPTDCYSAEPFRPSPSFPAFVINTGKSTFLIHLPAQTPTLPGKFSLHLITLRHAVLNTQSRKYSPPALRDRTV